MEISLSVQEHYSHQPQSFLHVPMPENSSCFKVRSFTFLYAGKSLFSGTGRFFQHRGMEKVPFQGPEDFSGMGEGRTGDSKEIMLQNLMQGRQQR